MARPHLFYLYLALIGLPCLLIPHGCSAQQLTQEQRIGNLGYFESKPPDDRMKGVIIGAPHGVAEPDAANYAKLISQQTGAGFLIASGFASKGLPVTQPRLRWTSSPKRTTNPFERGSIYQEFKALLRQTAKGNVKLYVGVRAPVETSSADRIEVATSGFTFEQLAILKKSFVRVRDGVLADSSLPKITIAIEPLEKISWRVSGVKHHGVLMFAERGLNLRLPRRLSTAGAESSYAKIIATWVAEAFALLEDNDARFESVVRLTDYGRIESVPSRKRKNGIVIGAPHGTFDEYTAELVNQVSYRTGLAAVITRGFTPTECGGWRINVNRPTERLYPSDSLEIHSQRAQDVYQLFAQSVLEASRGNLNLYVDIHQNGRQKNIEVATVGISKAEAQIFKKSYREIRDRVLDSKKDVTSVDLVIEPIDNIEIGAWAAKAQGILGLAPKSLHIEFPLYSTLEPSKARDSYTDIVTLLLDQTVPLLSKR